MYTATQLQQTCSFTSATLAAKSGQRCVAIDEYGVSHLFTLDQVYWVDQAGMEVGARVLVHADGLVEIASASFARYHEANKPDRECLTVIYER